MRHIIATSLITLLLSTQFIACANTSFNDPDAQRERAGRAQDEMRRSTY